jgi:uncharacterized protein YdeI (YjbR/CyaY-like superfamily)
MTPVELPILAFESPAAWAAWLEEHHAVSKGVWLKLAKKGSAWLQKLTPILFRLHTAKKAETRAWLLEQFAQMLERGEEIHN